MIIKNFNSAETSSDPLRYGCDIVKHNRLIILFVDDSEYANGMATLGRAAIINRCVYLSNSKHNWIHYKHDNAHIVRTAVYFCDAEFEVPNDIKSVTFTVNQSSTTEKEMLDPMTVGDLTTLQHRKALYSPAIGNAIHDPSNPDLSNTIMDWIATESESMIIPPEYYTEGHMYAKTSDYFGIHCYDYCYTVHASDLYDETTKVIIMNINFWATMKTEILSKLMTNDLSLQNTFTISDELNSSFENLVGENGIFIYDSNALGLGEAKATIKGGSVPLKEFYHNQFLQSNIKAAFQTFFRRCKDIENKFGNIRVMCYPSIVGTKFKAYFRDYYPETQPIKPVLPQSGNTNTIDNGYVVEKAVESVIDMYENEPLQGDYIGSLWPRE